jgi:hypothetical protein
MDGKNGERKAIEPSANQQATRFFAQSLAGAPLTFLPAAGLAGVAALEHRESVAAVLRTRDARTNALRLISHPHIWIF